ncbi:DNA helicase PcrA|uniref:ATP-dependent DNA helicase n=1 Tax=Dendrosporobacter quercicolus TaxID=146817 RepID=A0A1G9NW19_9FIRM|nr:DNA helicase PcrA [Dendrosporobacter quercicolus]NSL47455.1 DNA helicase PcrA [Dendrosporobacter quercicolus DSM 1736]SDL90175.1 DNA helicase-2 / ATP-dependent DNA helicase PcrA [Dendrosporobacter quercicolus]
MQNIFDGLNPAQAEAAAHIDGPLLIMAGAGSGKTKVLTCRIAYLLEQGVAPYNILAITFTNKAAAEMRERVERMVGLRSKDIWLSTFHAFCAKFLRLEIDAVPGYQRNFVIYDAGDCQAVVKACLKELNLDDKQFAPNSIQSMISNAKNALTDEWEFARTADTFFAGKVAEIYKLYQAKLRNHNALDFDDLLLYTVRLLETNPEVCEKYQNKFKYILIDEYQDTNHAQYLLAHLLAAKHRNLCVVGDADQSIYGWRGADIRNIMDFEKDYPEAKVVKLEQNYRSTKTILAAANAVIEHNADRKPKELWTENTAGEPISYYLANDERDEAQYIASNIIKLNTVYNTGYGDMAVLYRTNVQSRVIEEAFMKNGIPYTMVGGLRFYDRKEIKDILAYLRVIFNPADTVSLLRIINVPRRGIGDTTIGRLNDYAGGNGLTLFDVVSNPELVPGLTARAKRPLEDLAEFIFTLMSEQNSLAVADLIDKVMTASGYLAELEKEQTPQSEVRIENLRELLSVAKEFANGELEHNLENFLSHVALVSDLDTAETNGEKVTLMTLHSAKGLEFPVAFMAGLEEGLFPHARTLMNECEIEEERRICYVGITRARRKLYLTNARMRTIYGKTIMYPASRFLSEIPPSVLERVEMRPSRPAAWSSGFGGGTGAGRQMPAAAGPAAPAARAAVRPTGQPVAWKVGDKAQHSKWGVGTVVDVRGQGEDQALKVAFPGQGIKELMLKYAPIAKVEV